MRNLTDDMTDAEYAEQLVEYIRGWLTYEDIIEMAAGNSPYVGSNDIEALENWALEGISKTMEAYRPPESSASAYADMFVREIDDLPPRLMERAFWAEVEIWQRGFGVDETALFAEMALLQEGEAIFNVDLTEEIIDVVEHLDECETKVDTLEDRGAITGEEWYERTTELMEA